MFDRTGRGRTTAYLAYLTVAWNRLHYLYDAPGDAFLPPYDRTVESLFDNTHPADEVLIALPARLDELFTPDYLAQLAAPSGPLRDALVEADRVCDIRPAVPVVLYASSGDRDVPIDNAHVCRDKLSAHGARVEVVDFVAPDHAGARRSLAESARAVPSRRSVKRRRRLRLSVSATRVTKIRTWHT